MKLPYASCGVGQPNETDQRLMVLVWNGLWCWMCCTGGGLAEASALLQGEDRTPEH